MNFEELGLKQSLLNSIAEMGFKEPSPIQKDAIPVVLAGRDVVAQAHTGTGKTAAFGLPCLHNLKGGRGVEMLVVTPTRELANQVSDELYAFGKEDAVRTVTVFGGQSYSQQIDRIRHGAQVVVATPGRLLDLLQGGKLQNFTPSMIVLDEADEMLDMGFLEDIQKIFTFLPKERQTLLFSATMPNPIRELAKKILHNPETISVTKKDDGTINKNIEESYCVINESERDDAIVRLMDSEIPKKAIVFCRTKNEVDRLSTMLMGRGFLAKGLHGDMEQRQRTAVMRDFQGDAITVLVATDVAARGLDVRGITHVINFHIPFEPESYVHRIGRTARAGEKGKAITLLTPREWRDLRRITQKFGSQMTHRIIPTINDIQKEKGARLLLELESQKIHPSANALFEELVKEMGLEQTAQRLLSYVLELKSVEGPDSIGVKGEKLKQFFSEMERNADSRGGGSNRFRGGFRKRPPFPRGGQGGRSGFSRGRGR